MHAPSPAESLQLRLLLPSPTAAQQRGLLRLIHALPYDHALIAHPVRLEYVVPDMGRPFYLIRVYGKPRGKALVHPHTNADWLHRKLAQTLAALGVEVGRARIEAMPYLDTPELEVCVVSAPRLYQKRRWRKVAVNMTRVGKWRDHRIGQNPS